MKTVTNTVVPLFVVLPLRMLASDGDGLPVCSPRMEGAADFFPLPSFKDGVEVPLWLSLPLA